MTKKDPKNNKFSIQYVVKNFNIFYQILKNYFDEYIAHNQIHEL